MKSAKVKGGILLIGLAAVLLVSGVMGVTYAASKNGNNPNGKLDLRLRDQDDGWRDPVSATWVVTNMAPGDIFAFNESFVELRAKFPKKVDMGSVKITSDYDPWTVLQPDSMAKYMVITRGIYKFTYKKEVWEIDLLTGGLTITSKKGSTLPTFNSDWQIQDVAPADGKVTFYELKESPLTNLPFPRKAKEARFEMSVRFHEDAGNEFQGDTFNLTMKYTLSIP